MLKIAITGGIGAGKSTAVDMFQKHGVPVIDTDVIARELIDKDTTTLQIILAEFGESILDEQHQLDRAKLRSIIFDDETKRKKLQDILHPKIYNKVINDIGRLRADYCLIVIPLLIESSYDYPHDRVLLVDADESCQLERAAKRDNNSKDLIKKIMAAQASREERRAVADDIIDNSGSLTELQRQVDRLHSTYLKLASANQLS